MRYLLSAAALLLGTHAYACDCAEPPAPKKALEGAAAVLLAEADKVVVEGDTRIVTFKVDRWWKGGDKAEVTAFTHKDGATCGYRFEKGKKYLVYARMDKNKQLHVSLCSRTRTEKQAEEAGDFKELGEGKKPAVALSELRNRSGLAAAIAEASRMQNRQREMQRVEYARTLQRAYDAWKDNDNRRNQELLDRVPRERRGWEWYYLSKP
jgi:hypothetical protein